MCSCGEAEQDTAHILQTCKNHQALREEIWPLPTTLQEKLYGPVDVLQKTTRFVAETELPSVKANEMKKKLGTQHYGDRANTG